MTIGDVIDFVIEHRTNKVFKGYSNYQVAGMIIEGVNERRLYYSESEGKITGMILATVDYEKKIVWVEENLSMTLSNLKEFLKKAVVQFHGFQIKGFKCGKDRDYSKLINRFKY